MELVRALGDWTASISTSLPKLRVKSPFTLFGTLLCVSAISFSGRWTTILSAFVVFSLILRKGALKSLKVSLFWFLFTSILTIPRPDSFPLFPARVSMSILALNSCVSLTGFFPLIKDLELLMGSNLSRSLRVMVFQVSEQLRNLTSSVLAKRSRQLVDGGLTGEYNVLAMAVSEVFFRGPEKARSLELAVKSRMWYDERWEGSFRDTLLFLSLGAFLWGVQVCSSLLTFP